MSDIIAVMNHPVKGLSRIIAQEFMYVDLFHECVTFNVVQFPLKK